jgi:hypothetical protein
MADAPQIPTLEQMRIAKKVGEVFMVHAAKETSRLFPNEDSRAKFAHYTSAEAAIKIIRSKRLWMRNATAMSDFSEVEHGFSILSRLYAPSQGHGLKDLIAAVDDCVPGAGTDALNFFNKNLIGFRSKTYIASLSEHDEERENLHGRLSMWRAFGGSSNPRVALIISLPAFTGATAALSAIFSPVAYFTESEIAAQITQIMTSVESNKVLLQSVDRQLVVGSVFMMLLTGTTCLKHEGFLEEREWRVIHQPDWWASPLTLPSSQVINGVPQLVYELPIDKEVSEHVAGVDLSLILDRVIIGPTQFPIAIRDAVVEALESAKIPNAGGKVVTSGIPLRS